MSNSVPHEAGSKEPASSTTDSPETPETDKGIFADFRALITEYRALAHDHVRLAALEARHAGESLVRLIALGMMAGLVAFTAWLALVATIVAALVENNVLSATLSLLIMVILHVAAVFALVGLIKKQSRALLFSAVVDTLKPRAPEPPANQE